MRCTAGIFDFESIDLMEERSSPTQDTKARKPLVALGRSDVSNEWLTSGKRG